MNRDVMADGIRAIKDIHLKWYIEEEERRARNKRIFKITARILGALVILSLSVLLVLFSAGDRILLSLHGFSTEPSAVLCSGVGPDGSEYRIVCSKRYNLEQTALGIIKRNPYGLWEWVHTVEERDEHGFLVLEWSLAVGGPIEGGYTENAGITESEQHLIVSGNNAIAKIPDISVYLPEDVSSAVYQEGKQFIIHLISYRKKEYHLDYTFQILGFREPVSIYEILKDLGCLE